MPSNNPLRIEPVNSQAQLNQFIRLPWNLYPSDSNWVPPLLFELKERLSPKKNPFFEHARWQAWIAWQGDKPVGRISAQIDDSFQQYHSERVGYFGMPEAEDDPDILASLLTTAEDWLRQQDIEIIRGPFNLSINEECGLLVDGFDTPPSVMMGHALPYYGQHIESAGYSKAQDLLAYTIAPDFEAPRIMQKLAERAAKGVTIRPLRRKDLTEELNILRELFNDAWSKNWGFVPFSEAEFKEVGKMLAMLVDDDFIQIAELDQRPVAMITAFPNVNEVIKDLNGRLLPFGWLKLLWRLKVKYPKSARVALMGVRQEYHHTRLGPALAFLVIDAVRQGLIRKGIREVELSWILEHNDGMRNIIETIGGKAYKRYRIYEKHL